MNAEPVKFDTIRKHLPPWKWFGKWEVMRGLKEQEARRVELEAALRRSTELLEEVDRAFTNNNAMDWETLVTQARANRTLLP